MDNFIYQILFDFGFHYKEKTFFVTIIKYQAYH